MTQQNQTAHATRADIEAILKARRSAVVEAADTHSIPALPPHPTVNITDQQPALPITQPAALPIVVAAPTPTASDDVVTNWLQQHLPELVQKTQAVVQPPFAYTEVIELGLAVSRAVADGLPQVKGLEARTLVVVTTRYLWRQYAVPLLPVMAKPFAGVLETMIICGIEAGYQLLVKKAAK